MPLVTASVAASYGKDEKNAAECACRLTATSRFPSNSLWHSTTELRPERYGYDASFWREPLHDVGWR